MPRSPSTLAAAHLRHDLDTIFTAPALARGAWSIIVRSLDRDDVLYARNSSRLLLPASALKILTLAAAGEQLGWDFQFETRLVALGSIEHGVLHGDLFVVGTGDPTLVDRDGSAEHAFAEWARALRKAGISAIRGRIVGDDRAFQDSGLGAGWSWDDLVAGYAARVSALQFNDNLVGLQIAPGTAPGAPARVTIDPPGSGLMVVNRVMTAAAGGTASVVAHRLPGSVELLLTGAVPLDAAPVARTVSVDNPTRFLVSALRRALIADGVAVEGEAVDVDDLHEPPLAAEAHAIGTYRSAPLAEVAVRLIKQSQNLHAETLLVAIGRQVGDPTAAGGVRAIRTTLEGWGVAPGAFFQADGSGLSRYNYVSADALADVLTHVDRHPESRAVFAAALPVAGEDGTLEARFVGSAADGIVHAKTGSMSGVRTLAGYATTVSGERLVFAILGNDIDAPGIVLTEAIDACVVRLTRFDRNRTALAVAGDRH